MRLCVLWLFVVALGSACWDRSQADKEATEAELRSERLRRAREAQARDRYRKQWHDRYRRQIARATGAKTVPAPPPRACDPWAELRRRATALHHTSQFSEAVQLVLRPLHAGLVQVAGRTEQRFLFAVRMHPADEPPFGRKRARGELELDLRWVPLCPQGNVVIRSETLRLRLTRRATRSGAVPPLRPHAQRRLRPVPVGVSVTLQLDPTRSHLARGPGAPAPGTPEVGLWEITDARFAGRPRLRRLAQPTGAFGPRLARLCAVEVACPGPGGTCRFLTVTRGLQEAPLSLGSMLKLAAPIRRASQARQLFRILMTLKYPRCLTAGRRRRGGSHPCLIPGGPAGREACAYWRALNGFRNRMQLQHLAHRFVASQVATCPGKRRRVIRLEATFQANGDFQLRKSDLSARSTELEAELARLSK